MLTINPGEFIHDLTKTVLGETNKKVVATFCSTSCNYLSMYQIIVNNQIATTLFSCISD